ncbi:hypothetical protein GCM10023096_79890 [Nonomuraea ferruginea]
MPLRSKRPARLLGLARLGDACRGGGASWRVMEAFRARSGVAPARSGRHPVQWERQPAALTPASTNFVQASS